MMVFMPLVMVWIGNFYNNFNYPTQIFNKFREVFKKLGAPRHYKPYTHVRLQTYGFIQKF